MQQSNIQIPTFPRSAALALRVLPLLPISASLTAFSRRITKRSPGLFRRLGEYDRKRFILDPTDLPILLRLDANGGIPITTAHRKDPGDGDAKIAGSLAALLGLVHGAYDGDALFFSRDLVIEGDTAAALALRNAIDDAELDLAEEIAAFSGPLARPVRRLAALAQRITGVALMRPEEAMSW